MYIKFIVRHVLRIFGCDVFRLISYCHTYNDEINCLLLYLLCVGLFYDTTKLQARKLLAKEKF